MCCTRIFSGFFRIFFKSQDFFSFDHISLHNWWFTSQIWYDNILFWNFIRFRDFSGFSGFALIFSEFPRFSILNFFSFSAQNKITYDDEIHRENKKNGDNSWNIFAKCDTFPLTEWNKNWWANRLWYKESFRICPHNKNQTRTQFTEYTFNNSR